MDPFSPYSGVLANQFEAILKSEEQDKAEKAWRWVCDQQNRQDVIAAAQLFYKVFGKDSKSTTIAFIDGAREFGASQIECFKKESPTLEKMLNEGNRIALSQEEFSVAVNSGASSLEIAYYLNIPRIIEGAEQKILKEIDRWKNIGNYEAALAFFEKMNKSQLKNCPFYTNLIENELASLFGSIFLLYVKNPAALSTLLNRYKEAKISAISLSFETDASRSAVCQIGSIDSLRIMKIDSFEVMDSELSFPKGVVKVELKNTSRLTAATLKALPITVRNLTLIGLYLSKEDLKHLPSSLSHLVLKELFPGLDPVPLPTSLSYLELDKCFDFTDHWLQDLSELQTLIVKDCPKITSKCLQKAPKTLLHVEIIGASVQEGDLTHLPDTLQTLIIPNSAIGDSILLPSQLLKLDASGTKLSDEGLAKLSDKLTYLNVTRCPVKGFGLKHLVSLTHLYLDHCPIEKGALSEMPSTITHLSMVGVEIDDNDVDKLPNRMRVAVLNGASLTGSGLLHLARTLIDVKMVGTKMLQEEARKFLPLGCKVSSSQSNC